MTIATEATTEQAEAKQIVAQPDEARTEKQISLYYGERSEIRELVSRIKAGLPNAGKIPAEGILALATSAYAHDLDPWNGEIWVIYNEKRGETSLMAGVKGLRKAAKKQLSDRQHYYLNFRPILPEEYPQYALDTNDEWGRPVELAEICELRRGDACAEYSKTLRQIFDMCGSFEMARDMLGPMPVYIGIGVVRKGEKSKMEKCQVVKKRAESEALKRAFDLPFADRVSGQGNVVIGNEEEDVAIEGEVRVVEQEQTPEQAEQEPFTAPATEPDPVVEPEPAPDAQIQQEAELLEQSEMPLPEKPVVKAHVAPVVEQKVHVDQIAKPAPKKAEEKPAEPIKDNGEDVAILALKRCKPSSWVAAAEMLNKELKTRFTAGSLRQAAAQKLGKKDFEALSPEAGWQAAVELALEASPKK